MNASCAQRRPGTRPRRHAVRYAAHRRARRHRSTKAGDSAPATRRRHEVGNVSRHRSTKAGDSAPATPVSGCAARRRRMARSTKAGDSAPATPPTVTLLERHRYRAQRRPGTRPRRHSQVAWSVSYLSRLSLNEGRGLGPGDTARHAQQTGSVGYPAQRRPGTRPRRHPPARLPGRPAPPPLNEGRGLGPGDTRRSRCWNARRPGALNEGRGLGPGDTRIGHAPHWVDGQRSTKAGDSAPATRDAVVDDVGRIPIRSTKAGDSAPATLDCLECERERFERSTKAGDSAPATLATPTARRDVSKFAQRRPGTRPRRHDIDGSNIAGLTVRSTKAGDSAPATQEVERRELRLRVLRSTKAGDSAPATPRPRSDAPRGHAAGVHSVRSTKAGDSAPATRPSGRRGGLRRRRSTKAGDSAPATRLIEVCCEDCGIHAQRRPGTRPRRHR